MWCGACQQDVPGITTGVVPRPKCARCGNVLARGQFAAPHFAHEGVLESGMDLTVIPTAPALGPTCSAVVDLETRDRLREIGYVLKRDVPRWPRTARRPFDGTPMALDPGTDPTVVAPKGALGETATVPETAEHSSTFFWAAISAMLAFLLTIGLIWPQVFEVVASKFH